MQAPEQRVLVTEDDPSLPSGCRPAEVAGLLGELFDAVNRRDGAAASLLVSDPGIPERLEPLAKPRRLRLRWVIVGYAHGLGQIEFRAAGGLHGKGAVDCEARTLAAGGLGHHRERWAPLCGRRPSAPRAALACVRHWS